MKNLILLTTALLIVNFFGCKENSNKNNFDESTSNKEFYHGKWVRMTPNEPIGLQFKNDSIVEIDFGNNNSIDVISHYKVSNDTIEFIDEKGKACQESGIYKVYNRGYSISFDVLKDECNGRIRTTSGFWVRPNHKQLLSELNAKIKNSDSIEYVLSRGRIYLALGKSQLAKTDFDTYLEKDSLNAKVFIHRAATKFPFDLDGIVEDCNKSIAIDSTDKYAYFLRGLALYELGEKQKACDDFQKAIELGFTILKQAEMEKCEEFWKEF